MTKEQLPSKARASLLEGFHVKRSSHPAFYLNDGACGCFIVGGCVDSHCRCASVIFRKGSPYVHPTVQDARDLYIETHEAVGDQVLA